MTAAELRSKSSSELSELLLELNREQFNLRMQKGAGGSIKGHRVREIRRTVARIKTIMHAMSQVG